MDEPSDEALLAGVAEGDADASVMFVRRHQARVFGLAVAIVGDRQLAQDVAQEAFVRVWRHAEQFDPRRGTSRSWVGTIVRNLAIDALRLRHDTPADLTELLVAVAATDGGPADGAERHDDVAAVRRALSTLSEAQRRAVLLAGFYGWTAREISEAEGVPLGTAKTRIRDGLLRVRAVLAKELPT